MFRKTRPISWVKAARKDFKKFPKKAQEDILDALSTAAEGQKADIVKPMKGLGPGVLEVALECRGNAYRTIYCLKIDVDIWVIHAFLKKSKTGIKTPKYEIDLIKKRIKVLREILKND